MTPSSPAPLSQRARGKWRDTASLLLVLIIAAAARFHRLDAVEFFHDEAMVSMMAQEMADGLTFPLQGILSSVGIPNPPAAVYVMAVPFAFTSDPIVATGFVAALNVAAAAFVWLIARRYFGVTAALVAGLIFALNPWAILYSRKIWAQDYVNPFLLAALVAALWGCRDGRRWGQIFALPLMLFAMQIHFAAWALVPLFGWVGWTGRRRLHRGAVVLGVVLGALVMLPYLIGLTQTLQTDPSRIADVLDRSGGAREGGLRAVVHAAQLAAGTDIETWVAPHVDPTVFGRTPAVSSAAAVLALLPMLLGLIALMRRHRGWLVGFALWIIMPVAAFQVGLADVWPHYFVPLLPAFALLAGIGAAWTVGATRFARWPRAIAVAALAAGLGWLLLDWWSYYSRVMSFAYTQVVQLGEGTSGYTTPSAVLTAVRDAIPPEIDDVVVLTDGDRVWFDAEAARWPVLLRDRAACVRSLPPAGYWLLPARPFALIAAPTASDDMRERYRATGGERIPAREGEGSYDVRVIDPAAAWPDPLDADRTIARFSNGVALHGWTIDSDQVILTFALPDAPDRTFYGALAHDYQLFIHLLDAEGARIAQADRSFWPGRHWCAGDRLTVWTEVDAPAAATLRVGFYRLLDVEAGTTQAVDIIDEAGNAAGNWVDIPIATAQR